MIYTVGRIDIYEPYIESDKNAAKRKGGSVWETFKEASEYCEKINNGVVNLSSKYYYKVYGVDADWEIDTKKEFSLVSFYLEDIISYRILIRDAKLIKIISIMTPFVVKTPLE